MAISMAISIPIQMATFHLRHEWQNNHVMIFENQLSNIVTLKSGEKGVIIE